MSYVPASRAAATAPRWAMPALMILLVQVALYIWMAPRGFEFTDESYYFHNFLHWREFTGTVTFFGAYFEWPFRAMGTSIAGIRILSLLVVLASGALLMHQVLLFSLRARSEPGPTAAPGGVHGWWYLVAPMASAMLYFDYFSTVRAPSYNLLSLCTMAISTACLLHTLREQAAGRNSRRAPLLYGVALGACFLSKATTSLFLVGVHLLFFIAVNRTWTWNRLLEICVLIMAGFALNLVLLTAEFPGWLASLREGIEIMRVRGGYSMLQLLNELNWDVQRMIIRTGPWLLALVVLFVLVRRKLGAASRGAISLLALSMIGASMATISGLHQTKLWLFVMVATALGLWSLERLARPGLRVTRDDCTELALMALLFSLPVAFSFGTNMAVLSHSAIASVFAYCALYLRLYRLSQQGMLSRGVLAACVCLLCAPALVAQVRVITDVRYSYRQHSALGEQDVPVALGAPASGLRVDPRTGKSLQDIAAMASSAGFTPGQQMLDLTGDSPGVLYAIGASPLGTPWMIGGYPGSDAAAGRVIEKLDPAALRGAWLLTSTDNPRRIRGWEAMLAGRISPASHVLVASANVAGRYGWGAAAPYTVNLQLWKPAAPASR